LVTGSSRHWIAAQFTSYAVLWVDPYCGRENEGTEMLAGVEPKTFQRFSVYAKGGYYAASD